MGADDDGAVVSISPTAVCDVQQMTAKALSNFKPYIIYRLQLAAKNANQGMFEGWLASLDLNSVSNNPSTAGIFKGAGCMHPAWQAGCPWSRIYYLDTKVL